MTADSRRATSLRRKCLEFIVRNTGRVYATGGYYSLPPSVRAEVSAAVAAASGTASCATGIDTKVGGLCSGCLVFWRLLNLNRLSFRFVNISQHITDNVPICKYFAAHN